MRQLSSPLLPDGRTILIVACMVMLNVLTLQIAFSQNVLSVRINSASDDMEEYVAGTNQTKTVGSMDPGSSDLELGNEATTGDPQLVGLRFTNITIPKGALVTKATIQFTVDAISKNTDPCNVQIVGEANDNTITFNSLNSGDLSARPKTTANVSWAVTGSSWATVGSATDDQETPDIKTIIQEIIDRSGWAAGNALSLYIFGTGTREVESFEGSSAQAALLSIEYYVPVTASIRINSAGDDLEEYISGTNQTKTIGSYDIGSSDLELGNEAAAGDPQLVGMRFTNVTIPQGTTIISAKLTLTTDATGKNTDPCELTIVGENNDNAALFDGVTAAQLSSRPKTSAQVDWEITAAQFTTVGSTEDSPELKAIIQEIVNRTGWTSGSALALYISGIGTREVEAYDGSPSQAPLLTIEYYGLGSNPVTNFPIPNSSSWAYNDNGQDLGTSWKETAYTGDATWRYSSSPMGYGDAGFIKTLSFGFDANAKYPTYYFTKRFNVADVSTLPTTLDLGLRCDDGAIVYINGTQVASFNMPSTAVTYSTLASTALEGTDETIFRLFEINKSVLVNGINYIAVEVHQSALNSSDIAFDLSLTPTTTSASAPALGCADGTEVIGCFTSVVPSEQNAQVIIPSSHAFQGIFSQGQNYVTGTGSALGSFDFTAFVPFSANNSKKGYVLLNHETNPGGVSWILVEYSVAQERWTILDSKPVDFTATSLVKTERNCSGGITPWGTVVTCEETTANGDVNADGYTDVGWNVEIDAVTGMVKEYGNAKQEKLWAMGRMSHENVAFKSDSITAYYGEDASNGYVYKFIATNKTNLSAGNLYVLRLDQPMVSNEPTGTTGTWVLVPNTTQSDRNNTPSLAMGLGATAFSGVEDVEIGPHDGKIYFTAKGNNRTYSFSDNGTTVSNFITYVGGKSYKINFGDAIINEAWGSGNDNLTFDNFGNLYVLQDGSRNHVWVVRPDHTQAAPKVELFMKTPIGSEPTGMTFTPDYKFMFISIQSPSPSNTIASKDARNADVVFNKDYTIVVARKELLDGLNPLVTSITPTDASDNRLVVYPNPTSGTCTIDFKLEKAASVSYKIIDLAGNVVSTKTIGTMAAGDHTENLQITNKGMYMVVLQADQTVITKKVQVQ
ncbi:MAG: DUF839 domain-containing protein [Cytophagaceae bacterium]|jgi:hypothetical protein|nr:DUF839 domain-containing protein [Cytophagaceae bacterium]